MKLYDTFVKSLLLNCMFQAGYQITQKDNPIASNGRIDFIVPNRSGPSKHYYHSVRLTQLQLEEDSGKSIHDEDFDR